MRSSNGPDTLRLVIGGAARRAAAGQRRIAEMAAAARVHRRDQLDPRREGDVLLARATLTLPVSSGWRSESSTGALEFRQFVEEQHAEMRQADLAGPHPQPAADQRRHRGAVMRRAERPARAGSCPPSSSPATDATIDTSSASDGSSGGRIPGRQAASSDLPAPGGPLISRLCPPAAAISSARLATSCPLTCCEVGAADRAARPRPGRAAQPARCP